MVTNLVVLVASVVFLHQKQSLMLSVLLATANLGVLTLFGSKARHLAVHQESSVRKLMGFCRYSLRDDAPGECLQRSGAQIGCTAAALGCMVSLAVSIVTARDIAVPQYHAAERHL